MRRTGRVCLATWSVVGCLAVVTADTRPGAAQGACEGGPLTQVFIEKMLRIPVTSDAIERNIINCGVTFIPDDAAQKSLRAAGATDRVLDLLVPPPSSVPGGAWFSHRDGQEMNWMPGREFTMGSPAAEAGRGDDEAATALAVRGFWMDANEVSNRAFKRFVDAVPEWQKGKVARASADESYLKTWTGASFPAGEGDQPVVWVSWHAAAAYAKWAGKRLPTEAEWEFAARAGTSTPYWWGDVFDEAHANAGPQLRAVGDAASRNKWGLTDMLGNVWEWTASLSRPYPYRTDDGRDDPQGTGARAVRGGAAGYGVQFLRSADRNAAAPDLTSARLGFRCAR